MSADNISSLIGTVGGALPGALSLLQTNTGGSSAGGVSSLLNLAGKSGGGISNVSSLYAIGDLFGGPLGILNFVTPNFRKT